MAQRATISVHTRVETAERLQKLAEQTRRSRSFLANDAIEAYLDREEAFLESVQQGFADMQSGAVLEQKDAHEFALAIGTETEFPLPDEGGK